MYVILDSTALIADFQLTTAAMSGLLGGSKERRIDLFVPELVLLEVVHKWRERVSEVVAKAESTVQAAKRVGLNSLAVTMPSIDDEVAAYEGHLRQKLKDAFVEICAIPDVSHKTLVEKAIQRRAPFADRGAGYRDALIWESVKEVLRIGDGSVVFVTANKSDFGSSPNSIPQDLLDELTREDIAHSQLMILATTADAAETTLEHPQRITEQFEAKVDTDKVFSEHLFREIVEGADLGIENVGRIRSSDHNVKFLQVQDVYDISHFNAFRSWLISHGRIGVEFEAEADMDVDLEYEEASYPSYYFDPNRDPWPSSTTQFATKTVTGRLGGQLEFDEATERFSALSTSLWDLSTPDLP
jgi:hypothetical protein